MNTPNTPAHTPTPISTLYVAAKRGPNATFAVEAESNIKGIKVPIALCPYKPHAELICAAVNSHDKLREALQSCLEWMEFAIPRQTSPDRMNWGGPISKARAALKESEANEKA